MHFPFVLSRFNCSWYWQAPVATSPSPPSQPTIQRFPFNFLWLVFQNKSLWLVSKTKYRRNRGTPTSLHPKVGYGTWLVHFRVHLWPDVIKSPLHVGTLSGVVLWVNTNTNNILLLKMIDLVSLTIYKDQKQKQVHGYTLKGKWGWMKKMGEGCTSSNKIHSIV